MINKDEFLEAYRQQGREFKDWIKSYYYAAFLLHWISQELSLTGADLQEWVAANCPDVSWDMCEDMLHKLYHTPTGRQILKTCDHPSHFFFPS